MTIDLTADSAVFMRDFAETIQFRASPNATPRTGVKANINRQELDASGREDPAAPFGARRQEVIHVMLRNDSTDGVTPAEIVPRSSELLIAYPLGATDEASGLRWRRIQRILKQNAGCILVEVQS